MAGLTTGAALPRVPSSTDFDVASSSLCWSVSTSKLAAHPAPLTMAEYEPSLAAYRTACKRLLTQLSRQHANQLCAAAVKTDKKSTGATLKCRLLASELTFKALEKGEEGAALEPCDHVTIKTAVTALFPQTVETARSTANSFLFCRAQLFAAGNAVMPTVESVSILQTYDTSCSHL